MSVPRALAATAGQNGEYVKAEVQDLFRYDLNQGWTQVKSETEDGKSIYTYGYTAVSYTHLDVYKRQIQFFQHGDGVVGIELEYGIITVSVVADQFGLQYTDLIVVKESLLFYSAESGE